MIGPRDPDRMIGGCGCLLIVLFLYAAAVLAWWAWTDGGWAYSRSTSPTSSRSPTSCSMAASTFPSVSSLHAARAR